MGIRRTIQHQGRIIWPPLGNGNLKVEKYEESVIMGDSSITIQSMVESRSPKNKALRQIIKRVGNNFQFLGEFTFKDILRENSHTTDM